jgi:hypothetical protein
MWQELLEGATALEPAAADPPHLLIVLLLVSNQRWTLSAPSCALLQKSAIYSRYFESDSASTVWAERAAVFHNPEPLRCVPVEIRNHLAIRTF